MGGSYSSHYYGGGDKEVAELIKQADALLAKAQERTWEWSDNEDQTDNAYDDGYLAGMLGAARRILENCLPEDKEPKPEWKRCIRRLAPVECERLQGFPDYYTQAGITEGGIVILISDTQRYKCLGNAVSTNVIARIIQGWKELQED